MYRLILWSRRSRSIYQIYQVDKNIEHTTMLNKIKSDNSTNVLSKEDHVEVKKYLLDPLKYRMENELMRVLTCNRCE